MKQFVIDELRRLDYEQIRAYLDEKFGDSGVEGIYWIPILEELYSDIQKEHSECQPFFFAVEIDPQKVSCELLLRTKNRMRCQCIHYATETQRNWIIDVIDAIFEKHEIKT